jgi:hypothetical protein
MKRAAILAAVSLAAVSVMVPVAARAGADVYVGVNLSNTQEFYQPLQAYGTWIQTANYGQCWQPSYVENGWRPYTSGNWVATDYGWYWESTEPWGWATYHYGRWVYDTYYGWLWVPGVEWAPSWVCWREGGGYVGWAPMPPQCTWGNGGYFAYQESWVAPNWFVYIGVGNFCKPITPRACIANQNIIYQTVNVTKIKQINNIVINNGPSIDTIRRANPARLREVTLYRGGVAAVERRVPPALQESQRKPTQNYSVVRGRENQAPPTLPARQQELQTAHRSTQRPVVIRSQPEREERQNVRQEAQYPVYPPREQVQLRDSQRSEQGNDRNSDSRNTQKYSRGNAWGRNR